MDAANGLTLTTKALGEERGPEAVGELSWLIRDGLGALAPSFTYAAKYEL